MLDPEFVSHHRLWRKDPSSRIAAVIKVCQFTSHFIIRPGTHSRFPSNVESSQSGS